MTQQTKSFIKVAKTSDLQDGAMKEITVGEHEIFLARVGGKFYAGDNTCPHLGGKLGRGILEGTVVTCPRHASRFDLTDGHVIRWTRWAGIVASANKLLRPPRAIVIYPVKVVGETVLIEI